MENLYRKKLYRTIMALGQTHSVWNVFSDFLALSAICISNTVDGLNKEVLKKRENQYLETIGKYTENEQKLFSEMLVDLVMALEHELKSSDTPRDVLGPLFHDLELHNRYKGQFFTPQYVCDMMAKMTLSNIGSIIQEKGYATVCEPACGSGAMILSAAGVMRNHGFNYCDQLVVEAIDVDISCVYMCYLQLSLYGIPAVVIHGNSLTLEEWSRWYTPIFIIGGWSVRQKYLFR